jgi:Ca2+-transporting ATPase
VGIAMGSGSDISKDAAGIVLVDDNFSTIVGAIAEGRKIFDNIRRMLFYLLATTIGEALTVLGALLLGLPLPVTSIQILWINLVTDTAMVLPLGLEPAEKGLMKRPPRRPNDPLLDKILLTRMVIVALTMAVTVLVIVYILNAQGQSKEYIQTVAFMMLITAQWANAFNARSEMDSSFSRLKKPNWALLVGFVVAVASQALVMFGPLGPAFQIVDVPTAMIVQTSGLIVFAVIFVVELHKWIVNKSKSLK